MPQCGCFHSYDLARCGRGEYEVTVDVQGKPNLKDIVENSALAKVVSIDTDLAWFNGSSTRYNITVSGVRDEAGLRDFLDLLRSHIIIDLSPFVEECYGLAPYTVFDDWQQPARTRVGELFYQAKYAKNTPAAQKLGEELETFIFRHPRLRSAGTIMAAPKSDLSTPDLAERWAQEITNRRGWCLVKADKILQTPPQKELGDEKTEEASVARVANSMRVENIRRGANVLIVDDTIRSGGTMKEMARALHVAGASKVFGLSVAKDAKFTLGGVDLSRELWQ